MLSSKTNLTHALSVTSHVHCLKTLANVDRFLELYNWR